MTNIRVPKCNFLQSYIFEAACYAVLAMSIILVSCITTHNLVDGLYTPKLIAFFAFSGFYLILSFIFRLNNLNNFNGSNIAVLSVVIICAVYLYFRANSYLDVGMFLSTACVYFAVKNNPYVEKLKIVFCISCVAACIINLAIVILQIARHDNPMGLFSNEIALFVLFSGGIASLTELYKKFDNPFSRIFSLLFILAIVVYAIYMKSRTMILAISLMAAILYTKRWWIIGGIALFTIIYVSVLYKLDSTQGRMTILNIALSIPRNAWEVISGFGENGFAEKYMLHQADVLANLDAKTQYLADNINHPLNEFIYMYIKYGLAVFALAIILIMKACKNSIIGRQNIAILAMLFAFACVSYPFRYPISWVFLAFALGCNQFEVHKKERHSSPLVGVTISLLAIFPIWLSYGVWINESLLYNATGKSMVGKNKVAISYYKKIDDRFCGEKAIICHAKAEFGVGNYKVALERMKNLDLCDYETTLLKGEIYNALHDYPKSILCFELASKMCPSRFMPLYEIYNVAYKSNDNELKERIRTQILNKDIKVHSQKIYQIINFVSNERNQ